MSRTIEVTLHGGPQDGGIAKVTRGCTAFAVTEIKQNQTVFGVYELDRKDGRFKYRMVQLERTTTPQTPPHLDADKPFPEDPLAPNAP
jgi:hypothetical protein